MDTYIDYNEVSEYGRNFVKTSTPFVGLSELVNVAKLSGLVASKVDAVEAELQNARNDRSELRDERGGTSDAEEEVRETVSRFYFHLRSLPKTTSFDFDGFFPGKIMGDLSGMKPADLLAKAADVLRGFDTPKNKTIAGFASWQSELAAAHQSLADALAGKGNATGKAFVATAALIQARKDFLHAYNKIA